MAAKRIGPDQLEHGDMKKLLASFCLPAMAGTLITSAYNIVDQLYIGNVVGVIGNAAINVIYPAVTLITSLSLMCGVGASASMNLALGAGHQDEARKSVSVGFSLMVLWGAVMTIAMLGWTNQLLYLFGCTDEILPYAVPYARITALTFIAAMIGAAGPFLIRADGSANYALLCTAVGALLDVILDWLFVIPFGWGIAGAAWATDISQLVSAAMVVAYLLRYKTFRLKGSDFRPDFKMAGRISAFGAGPMFNFLTQALVQIFLNGALRTYGAMSVYGSEVTLAVAGVANKVNTIAVAVVTGLTNGMQPVVSYNFGKHNYKRVMEAGKMVIGTILAVSFCIFLCYQFIPVPITRLFGSGSDLYYDFAAQFFRIFLMMIAIDGLQSSVGGFFSAQGKPRQSILISLTRQVIFLPPLLVILPQYFGLNGVLYSGPIADIAMAGIAIGLIFHEYKHLKALDAQTLGV